jgi:hypothetical protein
MTIDTRSIYVKGLLPQLRVPPDCLRIGKSAVEISPEVVDGMKDRILRCEETTRPCDRQEERIRSK